MQLTIRPKIPQPTTEVHIGENLPFTKLCASHSPVLIADERLHTLAKSFNMPIFLVPSGEKAKTQAAQEKLQNDLFKANVKKDALLIALGGGATMDLVGFVASIYMRGLSHILIPTTLLAMVDAAIGGKTGIDTPFGKNLIGTTYYPKAVLIDLAFLKTLPESEMQNGLSEILKLGLVYNSKLWAKSAITQELIFQAVQAKATIIEEDPEEKGLRRILNFGHTIGHGLEKISDYAISHGKAVAIGSVAASHLSMQLGYLPLAQFEEIASRYYDLRLPKYNRKELLTALKHDKKANIQGVRFVLIDKIGHAIPFDGPYCRPVTEEELAPTLDWMEKHYG